MHAWLRNTVMRLRFIKPRSQVAATEAGEREKVEGEEGPTRGPTRRNDEAVSCPALPPPPPCHPFLAPRGGSSDRIIRSFPFGAVEFASRVSSLGLSSGEKCARARAIRDAPGPRWQRNDDSYAERDPPRWSEARERLSVQKSRQEFTPRASSENIHSSIGYLLRYRELARDHLRDINYYAEHSRIARFSSGTIFRSEKMKRMKHGEIRNIHSRNSFIFYYRIINQIKLKFNLIGSADKNDPFRAHAKKKKKKYTHTHTHTHAPEK